jgi:digeranylgeranylglycerophospholipid reductase
MIGIVGGGPAGCFYASKEKLDDKIIFEADKEIGKPISCTGILTHSVNEILNMKKLKKDNPNIVVSRINKFKIISPNNKSIEIKQKQPDYIVNRTLFDQHLAKLAEDNGAVIKLNQKVLGYKKINQSIYKIKTIKETYNVNTIVAADGPNSIIAKQNNLLKRRKYAHGWQIRCKYPDLEEGTTIVHLGNNAFSWITPEDNKTARVGIIGNSSVEMKKAYRELIKPATKILENQSGLVPYYSRNFTLQQRNNDNLYKKNSLNKSNKENIFYLGDSAGMIKSTTFGGIIYGLKAAKILAEDKNNYEKIFQKKFSKELILSNLIRKFLDKMNIDDANYLINLFKEEKKRQLLGNIDRNYPSKFLCPLLLQNPNLIPFGIKLGLKALWK